MEIAAAGSAPGADGDDAVARLGVQLIVHGSRFAREMSRRANSTRSLVAWRVLANLQHEGPMRIGELAAREGISQPAMTTAVNRLEGDALVVRGADASDGRASVVSLTDEGAAALQSFRSQTSAVAAPLLATLSAEELDTLARAAMLLERIVPTREGP